MTFVSNDLSVGPGGLFYKGQWVADVDAVVFTFPRSEVLRVSRFKTRIPLGALFAALPERRSVITWESTSPFVLAMEAAPMNNF